MLDRNEIKADRCRAYLHLEVTGIDTDRDRKAMQDTIWDYLYGDLQREISRAIADQTTEMSTVYPTLPKSFEKTFLMLQNKSKE